MMLRKYISLILAIFSLIGHDCPAFQASGYDTHPVHQVALEVLNEITDPQMGKPQVAAAIYNYVKQNIVYSGTSHKGLSWQDAAMIGFKDYAGDCYIFFSTAKALYEAAGIPNVDVIKLKSTQSTHYWSLIDVGSGWYHTDCTPRRGNTTDSFFLYTDLEMQVYSLQHNNCFDFDTTAYPARKQSSVQRKISFDGTAVQIKESW